MSVPLNLKSVSICCSIVPEQNETGIQEYDVYTDQALLTIDVEVDYEVAYDYLLIISVEDNNSSPPRSGELAVQVYTYS